MSRKTVILNQSLEASSSFTFNHHVSFPVSKIVIKQVLYSNVSANDNGIYLLWSSLTSSDIAAFYLGIQGVSHNPETTIPVSGLQQSIMFNVHPANAAFLGPTGQICLTLEFIE